jgi:hypothetical protein
VNGRLKPSAGTDSILRLDFRKLHYWAKRRDFLYLQRDGDAPYIYPRYPSYASPKMSTLLDYKVLKAAVEEIDEQEIKPSSEQLCRIFGDEHTIDARHA